MYWMVNLFMIVVIMVKPSPEITTELDCMNHEFMFLFAHQITVPI